MNFSPPAFFLTSQRYKGPNCKNRWQCFLIFFFHLRIIADRNDQIFLLNITLFFRPKSFLYCKCFFSVFHCSYSCSKLLNTDTTLYMLSVFSLDILFVTMDWIIIYMTMIYRSVSHSSTLAWKIPLMEDPGRLQSMGSLRVRHDWVTSLSLFTFMHWRRKWQPTPVFLPGESQGWGSLVGYHLWGHTELDTTEVNLQQQQQNLLHHCR